MYEPLPEEDLEVLVVDRDGLGVREGGAWLG